MLDANPVFVGAVYVEDDSGTDAAGDQFYVTFEGGTSNSLLTQFTIDTKQNTTTSNLLEPDVYFDTVDNSASSNQRGIGSAHGFGFSNQSVGIDQNDVQVNVDDGGTLLTVEVTDFNPNDVLVFNIDVDQFFSTKEDDQLTSGREMSNSIFTAEFTDPNYNFASQTGAAGGFFVYDYEFGLDDVSDTGGLSTVRSHTRRDSVCSYPR